MKKIIELDANDILHSIAKDYSVPVNSVVLKTRPVRYFNGMVADPSDEIYAVIDESVVPKDGGITLTTR